MNLLVKAYKEAQQTAINAKRDFLKSCFQNLLKAEKECRLGVNGLVPSDPSQEICVFCGHKNVFVPDTNVAQLWGNDKLCSKYENERWYSILTQCYGELQTTDNNQRS
jgi:hypothetical protein